MIRIGPKARLQGIRTELLVALMVLDGVLESFDFPVTMIVSHGVDGVHTRASCHYNGCALDIVFTGVIPMGAKQQIFDEFKAGVGQDFDVLFESPGMPNAHFHIEWQPKEAYK